MTDLRNAARLVLRTSGLFTVEQPPGSGSAANPPALAVPMSGQADTQPSTTASGTALMIVRDGRRRGLRRTKRASALLPGDAIRLKSGARVVITYVSRVPRRTQSILSGVTIRQKIGRTFRSTHRSGWLGASRVFGSLGFHSAQKLGDPQTRTIALNRNLYFGLPSIASLPRPTTIQTPIWTADPDKIIVPRRRCQALDPIG